MDASLTPYVPIPGYPAYDAAGTYPSTSPPSCSPPPEPSPSHSSSYDSSPSYDSGGYSGCGD